jgi:pimeloyl-ACP methyl ester carboxylesterase
VVARQWRFRRTPKGWYYLPTAAAAAETVRAIKSSPACCACGLPRDREDCRVAAATLGSSVDAVVSRGGRPDLAGEALPLVKAPTLLIVGQRDEEVLRLTESAYAQLRCKKALAVVPRATHFWIEHRWRSGIHGSSTLRHSVCSGRAID